MKIDISKNSLYKQVYVTEGQTVIDLGLLNSSEQDELGETFLWAATDLLNNLDLFKLLWENFSEYEKQNCLEYIDGKTIE